MTPERWQGIKVVLDGALEIERNDRAAFLDRACAHDASLRHELEVLLAADEEIGTAFLNGPGNLELTTVESPIGKCHQANRSLDRSSHRALQDCRAYRRRRLRRSVSRVSRRRSIPQGSGP
jgi:hypothetical protein